MRLDLALPAETSPGRARVVFHTMSLAAISFVMSANGNALPQLVYQRFHAHDKVMLLGACLFVGTCGSIAGVMASRGGELRARAVLASLAAMFAVESALFMVTGAWAYAALNALAQVGANYAMNHLDHAASASAGARHRTLHDASTTAARLFGMLAAPLCVTRVYGHRAATAAVLLSAFAMAIASASSLLSSEAERATEAKQAAKSAPIDLADRLFFGFAVAVYVALYLLAANLMYLLRDVVGVADAERRGGLAIVVVFVAALAANGAAAVWKRGAPRRSGGLVALTAPLPALALTASLVAHVRGLAFEAVLAGCAIVGSAYGVFLAEVRDRASRGAREEGKAGLLTMFNNMANVSPRVAVAEMIAAAAGSRASSGRTYGVVLVLVGALPWLGLPMLVGSRVIAAKKRER